jgi:hypothetical protein
MNWKQNLLNALKHVGVSIVAVLTTALLDWALSPGALHVLDGHLPPYVLAILIPILHSLQVAALNKRKSGRRAEDGGGN